MGSQALAAGERLSINWIAANRDPRAFDAPDDFRIDRDPALTEGQMRDSARYVTAAFRYERIEGADHWLQLTAADRVNALLLDFFASLPQSAAAKACTTA